MMVGTRGLSLQVQLVSFTIYFLVASNAAYDPPDNYLIDCGSTTSSNVDARIFAADNQDSWTLSALQTTTANTTSPSLKSVDNSILYKTARIFNGVSSYIFPIKSKGRHFIRLYFFPFVYNNFDLSIANFSVSVQEVTLLRNFKALTNSAVFKEYLVNVTSERLTISFMPTMKSTAFVNAIEVVSVPDNLIIDTVRSLASADSYQSLSGMVLESVHRINMGGPKVSPSNDTLGRTWVPDVDFLVDKNAAKSFTSSGALNWMKRGATNESAPAAVYKSLVEMENGSVNSPIFNISWEFPVDSSFTYLVRMHFCDVVSATRSKFFFNVYIGNSFATRDLDLNQLSSNTLAAPCYIDFITEVTDGSGKLLVSIGPTISDTPMSVETNAILNGLEIMQIQSSFHSPHDKSDPVSDSNTKLIVILAVVFSATALALLVVVLYVVFMRRKTATKSQAERVIASLTRSASDTLGSNYSVRTFGSGRRRNIDLAFCTPFAVLEDATDNFNEKNIIGIGGFGKVYRGVLNDNKMVAVKRANLDSKQGINEFHVEIKLLAQLKHKNLVSLLGYCDEGTEMILVYEYMKNGSLISNLCSSSKPHLSWKMRLEICIGAASGLHYLHTGLPNPIIHRDVKSANILLDKEFTAKVADFGLSKTGTDTVKSHITTTVKGSKGYFDPEYYSMQKLTVKSDVYSFGVVMLEVLCGRPVIVETLPRREVYLVQWVLGKLKKGKVGDIVDARIAGTILPESLEKFVETARNCLMEQSKDRPSMSSVLWNLEYVLQLEMSIMSSDLQENGTTRATVLPGSRKNIVIQEEMGEASQYQEQQQQPNDFSYPNTSKVFSQLHKSDGR